VEDLANIEGFDEGVATELQSRAQAWLENRQQEQEVKLRELGMSEELMSFEGLTPEILQALGEQGIPVGFEPTKGYFLVQGYFSKSPK
jgi:N utilization substance protein A